MGGGGCLVTGVVGCPGLSVYTRYFPLSTQKSQAERWEAAAVATLRSLFLECCVSCKDGFTLTSPLVLQSLREPLPPRAGHPVNLYITGCKSCFQAKHRSLLLASSASAKPPVTG